MLSPACLEALVLIDGRANVAQVVERASGAVLRASLKELVSKGLATVLTETNSDAIDPGDFFTLAVEHIDVPALDGRFHAEADSHTEYLRKNGYYVNMARRSAVRRESIDERKLTVLVVDDDQDIRNLLRMFLKLEGIDTRMAVNREEVIAAFRQLPLPDIVLLDVSLKDVNGFDILAKMRQHPVLKGLPVIMLTASATREAVLKGIHFGADGYITKPFEIHALIRAVKAVLGLKLDDPSQDWDYSL
ncbi:MAG: response regulator [Proteobacteria bacterium]|nr:response regulator [Pseudomonadota bacterium]